MEPWITAATSGLVLGLANAAHCAGMCGAFALRAVAPPRSAAGFVAYGAGKAFSYVVLGAVAGALGAKLLRQAGVAQAWTAAVAGLLLVLAGASKFFPAGAMRLVPSSLQNALSRLFGGLLRADLPGGRFTFGALNGLLPCGVVYLAALQAAATGGAARAACLMAGFGLGTLPVLGGVGALGGALRGRFTPRTLRFLGGTLLLLTGAVLIGRALLTISAGKPSCCH